MKSNHLIVFCLSILVASEVFANAVGTDFQLFNPSHSATHFVTVESSQTSRQGHLKFGLYLHYSQNLLPEFSNNPTFEFDEDNKDSNVTGTDLTVSLGVTDWMDVGVSVPLVITQSAENESGVFGLQYADKGFNELRTNLKVKLFGNETYGIAFVGSVIFDLIENNPFSGEDPGPSFLGQLVFDYKLAESWRLGLNVGYKHRRSGDYFASIVSSGGGTSDNPLLPFTDDVLASLGLTYKVLDNLDVIGEVYMRQALGDADTDGFNAANSLGVSESRAQELVKEIQKAGEALLGVKYFINKDLQLHAGFVSKVIDSPGVADFRVYGGVNYIMGPLWGATKKKMAPKPEPELESEPQTEDLAIEEELPALPAEPPAAPAPVVEKVDTFVLKNVLFSFGSDYLAEKSSVRQLDEFKAWLDKKPSWTKLVVEGHTDSIGSDASNMKLSQGRANRIRSLLIKRYQIEPSKIEAIGYGETQPIADNNTMNGRRQNRRVEIKVMD